VIGMQEQIMRGDDRSRPGDSQPRDSQPSAATFRSHVTIRGALLGMFAICLLACLLAAWRHADIVAGLGFVVGGILAPVYARRDALLHIVISAPVIFLLAEVVAQLIAAKGGAGHGSALAVLEGTFLTLANVAPWLLAGTAICLGIAMVQGLPECVRALRAGLRGEVRASKPRRG
jgi:hypothetical protein